jgi:hypothetical protein
MKTVNELLAANDDWLYLVRFENDQYLALKRQDDGRIDLVDIGCDDTGSDLSNWTIEQLETEISNWLNCIEATPEEKEDAFEQFARA